MPITIRHMRWCEEKKRKLLLFFFYFEIVGNVAIACCIPARRPYELDGEKLSGGFSKVDFVDKMKQ